MNTDQGDVKVIIILNRFARRGETVAEDFEDTAETFTISMKTLRRFECWLCKFG